MKTKTLLFFALVVSLLIVACSPAATPAPSFGEVAAMPTMAPAATEAPALAGSGVEPVAPSAAANRMVIKNADMTLRVEDVPGALSRVTQMAADLGGYVISSQTEQRGDHVYASLQMAVPSAQFEAALNQLRNIAVKVERESASGQDVSAEYVDLRSRLNNLEATAARVREFLAAAKTVEESLKVSGQLQELEAQIEQVKGQMKYYEGRAAFSTISLQLTPEIVPVEPEPTEWNPARTFERATDTLTALAQTFADIAIWLIVVFGPFGLIAALAFGLGWRVMRGARRVKA
jgi:hypothetical protein